MISNCISTGPEDKFQTGDKVRLSGEDCLAVVLGKDRDGDYVIHRMQVSPEDDYFREDELELANERPVAQVAKGFIPVQHSVRPDVNREFLRIDCPRGWEDVAKLTQKVLVYENRKFTFTGWNSDRNEAYFARPLNLDPDIAKIV